VLKHALALLNEPDGPVLRDFPRDAPDESATPSVPACPVDFGRRATELSETEKLFAALRLEFNSIHTWYTIAIEKNGRTAVGLSNLDFDEILHLYENFIAGNDMEDLPPEPDLADLLRLAAEDLKSCYFEAISSQPDQPVDVFSLSNWFWGDTHAASAINEVRKKCLTHESKPMKLTGKLLLVPRNQMFRFRS